MTLRYATAALAALLAAAPAIAQNPAPPAAPTTPVPPPWHMQLDLGWVQSSGNSRLSTLNFGEQLTYTAAPWKFTENFSIVNASVGDSTTANKLAADLRADYSFIPRLRGYGLGHYERDRFAGIARRFREEVGLSWSALVAPADTLDVEAGAGLTEERLLAPPPAPDTLPGTNYGSARVGSRYRHNFRPNTFLQLKGEYIQDLKNSQNQQVNAEASLVAPVSTHVAVKLGYAVRYNSEPPPPLKKTDTIASAGIQVVF